MTKYLSKKIELLPCPFCGNKKPSIERYGTARVSTIYSCGMCGCSLETGETWNHGKKWNERATTDPSLEQDS